MDCERVQRLILAFLLSVAIVDFSRADRPEFEFEDDSAEMRAGIVAYQAGEYKTALSLLELPAARGNFEAQRILGIMHLQGNGTEPNPAGAARWIRSAAHLGDAQAQELLSFMHNQGVGVPQDYVLAYVWLKLAMIQNHEPEREQARQSAIAQLMKNMPKHELNRARQLSRDYYNRHVKPFL